MFSDVFRSTNRASLFHSFCKYYWAINFYSKCIYWFADVKKYCFLARSELSLCRCVSIINPFIPSMKERKLFWPLLPPAFIYLSCEMWDVSWVETGFGLEVSIDFPFNWRRCFRTQILIFVPLSIYVPFSSSSLAFGTQTHNVCHKFSPNNPKALSQVSPSIIYYLHAITRKFECFFIASLSSDTRVDLKWSQCHKVARTERVKDAIYAEISRTKRSNNHKNYYVLLSCLVGRPKVVIFFSFLLLKSVTSLIAFRNESFIFLVVTVALYYNEDEERRKPLRNPSWWMILVLWINQARMGKYFWQKFGNVANFSDNFVVLFVQPPAQRFILWSCSFEWIIENRLSSRRVVIFALLCVSRK